MKLCWVLGQIYKSQTVFMQVLHIVVFYILKLTYLNVDQCEWYKFYALMCQCLRLLF